MGDIMAFFDSFTDSIKQKWLNFFQVNRDWITMQMVIEFVYTPDGGKRPSSYLILGVVNALEPKLAQLMFPFVKLNPDANTLIEVLGLHFDPDILLVNRLSPTTEPERYSGFSQVVTEDISKEEEVIYQDFSMRINVTENNSAGSDSQGNENASSKISLSNYTLSDESGLGDLSLSDANGFDDISQPDESEFRDVLSNVWDDETSLQEGEDNNGLLGEELPSEVFDESEMARLFPNN
jgi:hypothetical protein